jgi:hypothetical protein
MNKFDYLELCFKEGLYKEAWWVYSVFTVILSPLKEAPYALKTSPVGHTFLTPDGETVSLKDTDPTKPLFHPHDSYTANPEFYANMTEPTFTTVGNAFENMVLLVACFEDRIPYMNDKINLNDLGKVVAKRLVGGEVPENPEKGLDAPLYILWLYKLRDSVEFLSSFSQVFTISATRRSLTPPTGLKEFNAGMQAKYAGRLNDKVAIGEYTKECDEFDQAWLKDDPSNGKLISGKIRGIARMKKYYLLGADRTFPTVADTKVYPVMQNLSDGLKLNKEEFVINVNSGRYASSARGTNTRFGGVALKLVGRALTSVLLVKGDCGTKRGIKTRIYAEDAKQLVGSLHLVNGKWERLSQEYLNDSIGKWLIVRTPMYCLSPPLKYCEACASAAHSEEPNGAMLFGIEITSIFMMTFMAMLHPKPILTGNYDTPASLS